MQHTTLADLTRPRGTVRTLSRQEELPLLCDHLLRLDRTSRHDRFHGFMDDSFIKRYAEKCAEDGTVVIAYIEDGAVRGAAELHPAEHSEDGIPEIAFSVESKVRRQGVGTVLFRKLISVARAKGYKNLRITTGANNEAMRALANKFGAHLPLYRQQDELARAGLFFPRSTLCDWVQRCGELLKPLVALMHEEVLKSRIIQGDDTPAPLMRDFRDVCGLHEPRRARIPARTDAR